MLPLDMVGPFSFSLFFFFGFSLFYRLGIIDIMKPREDVFTGTESIGYGRINIQESTGINIYISMAVARWCNVCLNTL